MRTEIERDKFTNQPKSDPFDELERGKVEKEKQATKDEIPSDGKRTSPDPKYKPDKTDENGYEWIIKDTEQWYRVAKSSDEWILFVES